MKKKLIIISIICLLVIALFYIAMNVRNNKQIEKDLGYCYKFQEDTLIEDKWNYEKALSINNNIIGVLKLDIDNIYYPIILDDTVYESKIANTPKYYSTNVYGQPSSFGEIWTNSSFSEKMSNNIFYAKNEENGFIFGFVEKLKQEEVARNYGSFSINIKGKETEYKIISSFSCNCNDSLIETKTFKTKEEYTRWINKLLDRSRYDCGFVPNETNKIITLVAITAGIEEVEVLVLSSI